MSDSVADEAVAPRLLVRREQHADRGRVAELVTAAFAKSADEPGTVEARLIDALRASPAWIRELSLVAEVDEVLAGHVLLSRATVDDRPVLALGPLAVEPSYQRRGVGTALVHAALGAAEALGEPLVALLGHLDYYPRFGFVPGTSMGIDPPVPEWGEHFQVRPLATYDPSLRGRFAYAAPFDDL